MKQIDAALLKKMFIGGAKRLEAQKEHINELNVFPVPDGDTGTNGKGYLGWIIKRSQRKLRGDSVPAVSGLYKTDQIFGQTDNQRCGGGI